MGDIFGGRKRPALKDSIFKNKENYWRVELPVRHAVPSWAFRYNGRIVMKLTFRN